MVQFNKLRLSGFKSFVDQTELLIESGMTGIVGPNGCGKSNLVEALRWVMGETSAKRMRGSEMDDVIFAGSSNRPPRNLAEVCLVLNNEDRTAPAAFNEYQEIEVVRRIARGSGSNYKVNGKDVRARDVQLLFADAASGSQSTALVSQGRIGEIINARPANRRLLLEEAAGITGLHSRRHEAELRLKAAESNLERLEDVVTTLEAQLQGLKKQARQASRYRNLAELIRQHEAILLHYESVDAQALLNTAAANLTGNQKTVSEKTAIVAQKSTAQLEITAKLPNLREAETTLSARLQRLLLDRENLQREEQQAASALTQATELLQQLTKDRERAAGIHKDAKEAEQRLNKEKADINQLELTAHDRRQQLEQLCSDGAKKVTETDRSLSEISNRIAANEARTTVMTRRLSELKIQIDRHSTLIDQQLSLQKQLKEQRINDAALKEAATKVQTAEISLQEATTASEELEKQLLKARQQEELLLEQMQTARNNHQQVTAEVNALKEMLQDETGAITHPIMEELSVTPGYEKALGAALGEDLNAGSEESAVAHWHNIPRRENLPQLPEGVTSLIEYVDSPERMHSRLSQIGVIESRAVTDALYAQLAPGQRLVSREGTLWRWDGLTVREDAPSPTAVRLAQKNRLRALEKQQRITEEISGTARAAYLSEKELRETLSQKEKEARSRVNSAFATLTNERNKQVELTQKDSRLLSQLEVVEENLLRLQQEKKDASSGYDAQNRELQQLPDLDSEKEKVSELRSELSNSRQILSADRAKLEQHKRDADGRKQRLGAIAAELDSWLRRTRESDQYLGEISTRIKRTEAEISVWQEKPLLLQKQHVAIEKLIAAVDTDRKSAADNLRAAELQQAEADRQLRESEQDLSQARENMIRAESEVAQAKQAMAILIDRVRERLGYSLEKALSIADIKLGDDLPLREEVMRKHNRLTAERDNMGPVNLRAEKEAEELEAQIKAMLGDKEDLLQAISKLRQGISNLNREGRDRLLKAFARVNAHFSDLFVRLFGGGQAHLSLVDAEDPLQAGLEIMASPPGKRLQVMSLLSGGEQALTALALLFAVFLTNPAPICVLDEVDAPLDDANVDRFCKLVEELVHSTSTRFLIISHHRMTMARVHRLYGVTMSERGVSQLVSVNLEAADALIDE
ncbi:chromosome segregation protein SMC [Kiloniella laminariae]|uniref:Chromosome partition protein Smc n=1 Tax=Kiloniella laminariae TaxID=454162 RepID=A0ABT4LL54_9PROT|nr:chromosome segregation protein SMC [Kiloniella laminariae]MCZ4281807.1 chromosome segregation protein SMC [Kiloniella laminariae]